MATKRMTLTVIVLILIATDAVQALIEVNEEGTEAAAATAVVMKRKSMLPPVPVFHADRPFVFMIRDNRSGSILSMGGVMNPAKEGGTR